MDCIFITEGEFKWDSPPTPIDPNCHELTWNGRVVENIVKNASMEKGWLTLNNDIGKWIDQNFSISISDLFAVSDKEAGIPYIYATGSHLFATFWTRFGWGDAPLLGKNANLIFGILSIFALFGNMVYLYRNWKTNDWNVIVFLFLVTIITISMALFRAHGNWISYTFTPVARYFFPAIVPLGIFLVVGWDAWVKMIFANKMNFLEQGKGFFALLLLFIFYNAWSFYSIVIYYYK